MRESRSTPHDGPELRDAVARGHENDGLDIKGISIAAVALVAVVAITFTIVWRMWINQREDAGLSELATAVVASPSASRAPPLQGTERHNTWPYEDVEKMKRDNEERLKSSGRNADGSVHIPIEMALELVIERKLLKVGHNQAGRNLSMKQALSYLAILLTFASSAMAQLNSPSTNAPPALRDSPVVPAPFLDGIGIDQKLDQQLPLELRFRDEQGRQVLLGDYFGKRPVLLTLVYYRCSSICTMTLNTLTSKLGFVPQNPGENFEIVIVSFNPNESPEMAARQKNNYMGEYKRPGTESGWHFLTGDEDQIQALAAAVGFRYRFDPPSGEYIHPAGLMVATPSGKLSKYFYGTDYEPRDLRLGISEAGGGRIGTLSQRMELFCYRYDMTKGKYTFAIWRVVRAAGLVTMLALGSTIFLLARRGRRRLPSTNLNHQTKHPE